MVRGQPLAKLNIVAASLTVLSALQQSLLDLLLRTEDQALRWEATRIFVNIIRSEAKAQEVWQYDSRVSEALADMLRTGSKHALLVNEAVIGLTLMVLKGRLSEPLPSVAGSRIPVCTSCQAAHDR
jgi:hypothetical protein